LSRRVLNISREGDSTRIRDAYESRVFKE